LNVVGEGEATIVTRSVHPSPTGVGYGHGVVLFGVSSWLIVNVNVNGARGTPSTLITSRTSSCTDVNEGSPTSKFRCVKEPSEKNGIGPGNVKGGGIVAVKS
jgi:hypothetical protein